MERGEGKGEERRGGQVFSRTRILIDAVGTIAIWGLTNNSSSRKKAPAMLVSRSPCRAGSQRAPGPNISIGGSEQLMKLGRGWLFETLEHTEDGGYLTESNYGARLLIS